MIAGLPIAAWALLIVAVGLGLAIELSFYLRHWRRHRSTSGTPSRSA